MLRINQDNDCKYIVDKCDISLSYIKDSTTIANVSTLFQFEKYMYIMHNLEFLKSINRVKGIVN